jgi:hypothetical protein
MTEPAASDKAAPAADATPAAPASAGQEPTLRPVADAASRPISTISTDTSKKGIDDVNPLDFRGDVATNNELPSEKIITQIENYVVLDRAGKSHPFKSLYSGRNSARRVLIIFIRHFFCGVSCPVPTAICALC